MHAGSVNGLGEDRLRRGMLRTGSGPVPGVRYSSVGSTRRPMTGTWPHKPLGIDSNDPRPGTAAADRTAGPVSKELFRKVRLGSDRATL